VGEFVLSCNRVIPLLKLARFYAIFLQKSYDFTGGEGWNRTRPAFHKPLEVNHLNHHQHLENKGDFILSQANSSQLFLTPFYSPPNGFAGTSVGTLW
jgi:hypothetical protein